MLWKIGTGKDYIPDISVYPKMKPNRLNDKNRMSEMPLAAIEILSPTQGSQEVIEKFKVYFEAGVKSCWLVDPVMQGVIVCSDYDKLSTFYEKDVVDNELDLRVPVNAIFE